jgi:type VI secretion system protein ImpA
MPLRTDLLDPIEGPNPAGVDLTYELILDELQEARREDIDVDQGEWERPLKRADHAKVIELGSEIIAKQSKDLTVAAWVAEALLHKEGFTGFREGVELLRGLTEHFWDHLYPELEEDDSELRAGPLNWVGSKLDFAVRSVPLNRTGHDYLQYSESRLIPTEEEAAEETAAAERRQAAIDDAKVTQEDFQKGFQSTPKQWYKDLVGGIAAASEAVQALDQLGREKFGDYDAPSYVSLNRAMEEVASVARSLLDEKLRLDPDLVEPEPVPVGAPQGGSGAGTGGAPKEQVVSLEPVSATDADARIAAAARFLRRADPRNPGPYLMLRGYRWGELRAGGGDLDPRLLEAPPTASRTHLKGLLLDGRWDELLDACEQVMATPHGRGWLDLQRYVLTACESLGGEYEQVARAVTGELRALLVDLPQLLDSTLMDDTPTANAETRAWLGRAVIGEEELSAAQGAAAERAASRSGGLTASGREVLERALANVRAGDPQKGIALLMRHAEQEKSERARFLGRSEAAGIMVDAGLTGVALPILRELYEQITSHNLEDWEEGEVIARPLGLLHQCLDSSEYELQHDLYQRICKLDPLLAIKFGGAGGAAAEATDHSEAWGEDYSQEYGEDESAGYGEDYGEG